MGRIAERSEAFAYFAYLSGEEGWERSVIETGALL